MTYSLYLELKPTELLSTPPPGHPSMESFHLAVFILLVLLGSIAASRYSLLFPGPGGRLRLRSLHWLKTKIPRDDRETARFTAKDLIRYLSLKSSRNGLALKASRRSSLVDPTHPPKVSSAKTSPRSYSPDAFITTLVGWNVHDWVQMLYICSYQICSPCSSLFIPLASLLTDSTPRKFYDDCLLRLPFLSISWVSVEFLRSHWPFAFSTTGDFPLFWIISSLRRLVFKWCHATFTIPLRTFKVLYVG